MKPLRYTLIYVRAAVCATVFAAALLRSSEQVPTKFTIVKQLEVIPAPRVLTFYDL